MTAARRPLGPSSRLGLASWSGFPTRRPDAERKVMVDGLAQERAGLRNHWNARIAGAPVAAEKGT
jgi:hypothetical protein